MDTNVVLRQDLATARKGLNERAEEVRTVSASISVY